VLNRSRSIIDIKFQRHCITVQVQSILIQPRLCLARIFLIRGMILNTYLCSTLA